MQKAIKQLINKGDLSKAETTRVMDIIMSGHATDAQIGSFLTALSIKGETIDEITGAATVMREKSTKIPINSTTLVDTCGTGGDGINTFNISTVSAFVAAGAGVKIAKHGNRAVSSSCGSADVLKALGVNIELSPSKVAECVDNIGIGFLFAPLLHGAMKYAIGPRREMGVRTIFNILGPLTNPASAKRQILGVFSEKLVPVMAGVLKNLGSEHVMVVHGEGLDELNPCGITKISELKNGEIKNYEIDSSSDGVNSTFADLAGGTVEENAKIVLNILNGEVGAKRDAVVLNGGAAIYIAGLANSLDEGIGLAKDSIDSNKALGMLEKLIKFSN